MFDSWNNMDGTIINNNNYCSDEDYYKYVGKEVQGPNNCKKNDNLRDSYLYNYPPKHQYNEFAHPPTVSNIENKYLYEERGGHPYLGCQCRVCDPTNYALPRSRLGGDGYINRFDDKRTLIEREHALLNNNEHFNSSIYDQSTVLNDESKILLIFLFMLLLIVCGVCLNEFIKLKLEIKKLKLQIQQRT